MEQGVCTIHAKLSAVGITDVGSVRTLNEDSIAVEAELGLLVVADGMGGHDAGEVASKMVINTLISYLQEEEEDATIVMPASANPLPASANPLDEEEEEITLKSLPDPNLARMREAVHYANQQLSQLNRSRGYDEGTGMGSTVVGYWQAEAGVPGVVFHVGDSRLYLFRDGDLRQITRDHSMYEQWKAFGSNGQPPAKNILTQAMGPVSQISPDILSLVLQPHDVMLLCSDGLSGMVSDQVIADLLFDVTQENLAEQGKQLIELAKLGGGKDNVSIVLAVAH
uniref:PPM-type phosphatase domain-containing protein n=1 Tax=Magnetococcus massalia (strain MO-1) TaxID=451514 RepID=A0A1S7LJ37_MAGMO|nr:putative Protein serine/threonine phosphatase 2C type [Candidatus Magnetococcus massalia]